jgi:hypothetical protein
MPPTLIQKAVAGGPRVCISLLAALALGCLPTAVTQAAETAQLKVAFSPYRLGSSTTMNMKLDVASADGGLPSPVTGFDIHLPSNLELIGSTLGLAICQPSALLAEGLSGCSPNAILGSGTATAAVPFGPEVVSETAYVKALMGPPVEEQVGVLLYAESRTPVFAQLIFPGKLLISSGPESLNTSIPVTPTLPGAPDASVTNLKLEVGPAHLTYYKRVHGRRVGYHPEGISLPSKCPRGGFPFVTDMRFLDGTALRVSYDVPCPSARHR